MWLWGRAAYDNGEVSLLRLLPTGDDGEFMRFVYPLRARAAIFYAVLSIVYYVINLSLRLAAGKAQFNSAGAILGTILSIVLDLILLFGGIWGSPAVLSKVIHIWYIIAMVNSAITVLSYAFLGAQLSLLTAVVLDMFVLLILLAVGTTMHINFMLFFFLALPVNIFLLVAIDNSFSNSAELELTRTQLIILGVGLYIIAMWTVHTVQYNTVMMFVWNKKYRHERLEKDAQKRMEELHRLHLANTLHDIGCPLQAFVNGLDEVKECLNKISLEHHVNYDLNETLASMEASITLMSLARRRAIAYAKSFNRLDALRPDCDQVHIRYLVEECFKVIKAFSRSHHSNVPITYSIADEVPLFVYTDGDWLMEALTNYLSNAIKFTDTGSIQVKVSLRDSPRPIPQEDVTSLSVPDVPRAHHEATEKMLHEVTFVHVEVIDTGRGVPAESVSKLFRPFSQLQSDIAGTGLGLLSVKTKIELLDGAVGVEPNHPQGSIFWFDIPLVVDLPNTLLHVREGIELQTFKPTQTPISSLSIAPDHPITMSTPHTATSVINVDRHSPIGTTSPEELIKENDIDPSKIRLLIVEDEKMLLRFSVKMFSGLGFLVDEAGDGAEGLQRMQNTQYDVVVMDQNMPHLGGLETVRLFRDWQANALNRGISMYSETESGKIEHKSMRTTSLSAASDDNAAVFHKHSESEPVINPHQEAETFNPLIFMMSASIIEADRIEAHDLGISDYFEKPLHIKHVAAMILLYLIEQPTRLHRIQKHPLPDG